ncbi:NADH dehydrogenase [ubiquinone] 1 beta subcomplex subunit 4 isoform X1 [Trachemys scripta elegans]|uniref:NADH dehydrogenase [ubiquinone] 1 beta subcomplex subunit 4 isoform X1 n=1 Tax=Trachemys scripta elegans TaxID=31138 RepID=UPI001553DAF1|nr:NADH dehydrogenase [ubiquinone] 1 beta subcomplex subunit 4 isoform X1 [Trachemys scripta elegans]
MAEPSSRSTFSYRPAPLASLPRELDPNEYNEPPEKRQAQAERLALRARLKRQYQTQLNDPHHTQLIEDPAMNRWTYARTYNIYPNFRPTPKTSLLGALSGIVKRNLFRKARTSDHSLLFSKFLGIGCCSAAVGLFIESAVYCTLMKRLILYQNKLYIITVIGS